MRALDTTVTGQVTVSLAATAPNHVLRLGEFQTAAANFLPVGSTFVTAQITD